MQLRKPLAPRSEVASQALELMQRIAVEKCNKIAEVAKSRRRIVTTDRVLLNKILPLARGEQRAMDQLFADLCGLPFQRIDVAISPSQGEFLHGATRTILVDKIAGGGCVTRAAYDIGEYDVYLHPGIFANGRSLGENIHFIPRRAPEERSRHWHHVGYGDYNPSDFVWSRKSGTCMNTYGSIFGDLSYNLAFAEFFRIVHNFLSHYYSGSPLSHPSSNIVKDLK